MFKSTLVEAHWDTWVFVENGSFYAYYLITEHVRKMFWWCVFVCHHYTVTALMAVFCHGVHGGQGLGKGLE